MDELMPQIHLHTVGHRASGFTIVELMIVVAIVAILAMIAVPAYTNYNDRVDIFEAKKDIIALQLAIDDYELEYGALPNSLADVGMQGMTDPWGNPYAYGNHDVIPPGHRRKDHSLVPINSDYDLYSNGPDGGSVPPLTGQASRDDIVRARDGGFIDKAENY